LPPIAWELYIGKTLASQLAAQAKQFMGDGTKFVIDRKN
jgi:hypothetical protein